MFLNSEGRFATVFFLHNSRYPSKRGVAAFLFVYERMEFHLINKRVFKLTRIFLGYTQAQYAARLQISRSHVASIENGYRKITPKMAAKLRKAFYFEQKTIDQLSGVTKQADNEQR